MVLGVEQQRLAGYVAHQVPIILYKSLLCFIKETIDLALKRINSCYRQFDPDYSHS